MRTKEKNRASALGLAALIGFIGLASPTTGQAQLGTVADVCQIAGTVVSIGDAIRGTTTLQPVCCLKTWKGQDWGLYRNIPWSISRSAFYSSVNQTFFYQQAWLGTNGVMVRNTAAFPIDSVARFVYRCDLTAPGSTVRFLYISTEDYSLEAWVQGVQSSGLFPPGPPFEVAVRTIGTRVQGDCNPVTPHTGPYRKQLRLPLSGRVQFTIGTSNYEHTWPPAIWVGSIFKFG